MDTKLIKSLHNRYAVQKFDTTKKLTDDQIKELLEAARLTPTSFGLQLMKILVVEDIEKRAALTKCSFGQVQIEEASHLLVLCREKEIDMDHIEDYINNISTTRSIGEDSLSGFKNAITNSILTKSKEDQVIWMEKQVYIAMGNLITCCAILGIGSCPMEGFNPEEYNEVLKLNDLGLCSVLVLPIGYASQEDPNAFNKKVRRSQENFVIKL